MNQFTYSELLISNIATRRGIANRATKDEEERLRALVENTLDPLREAYGKPITVTSGFRCEQLNRAVGGAKNSQHMRGEAADITAGTAEQNRLLVKMLVDNQIPFDQWVHPSYRDGCNNRGELLKCSAGKYEHMTEEDYK